MIVQVKVKEGERERLQAYEGVVIAKKNRGLNSAFTVRKISNGVGVERVFQTHSPVVASIEVKRRGRYVALNCTIFVIAQVNLHVLKKNSLPAIVNCWLLSEKKATIVSPFFMALIFILLTQAFSWLK